MFRKLFMSGFMAAALFLSACTMPTTENYNAVLDTWVGQAERDLVLRWGIPDREYDVDDNTKLISYKSRRRVYYPGSYSNCFGRRAYRDPFWDCTADFPPVVQHLSCETTFTSMSGRIIGWRHAGNDCQA